MKMGGGGGACSGLSGDVPKDMSTSQPWNDECDLIWKESLCRCN